MHKKQMKERMLRRSVDRYLIQFPDGFTIRQTKLHSGPSTLAFPQDAILYARQYACNDTDCT